MAATNDPSSTMTFSFATPVSAVGGFLNYVPYSSGSTTIAAYTSSNTLIESYNLSFLTSGADNTGQFIGFSESSPIISNFTLTGHYIGITQMTVTGTPEPGTIFSAGAALLGLAGLLRRKKRA